jgi:hypothetical protein
MRSFLYIGLNESPMGLREPLPTSTFGVTDDLRDDVFTFVNAERDAIKIIRVDSMIG